MKIVGHPRFLVARRFIIKFAPHRWGRDHNGWIDCWFFSFYYRRW